MAPRAAQIDLVEAALRRRCCVLVAPPATGKTIAMTAAGLAAASASGEKQTVNVIVMPTVELVVQGSQRVEEILGEGSVLSTSSGLSRKRSRPESAAELESQSVEDTPATIKSLSLDYAPGSIEERLLKDGSPVRFVVCTPERFNAPAFVQCLGALQSKGRLGIIFIDEGHLVAQWGLKFRESYLQLKSSIRTAFSGGLTAKAGEPQVMVLSGSMNLRQAHQSIELLGLDEGQTDIRMHPLDRAAIEPVVLDLNDVDGPRTNVLREGARRMAEGCQAATRSIVFVATADDAKLVAAVLNETAGIVAVPFYRSLDDEGQNEGDPGVVLEGRSGALQRWRDAWSLPGNPTGVLVSTVLAAHGIDDELVDHTGHLDMRSDSRALAQELGRACRQNQESKGNVLARHPELLSSAAFFVDFSDGGAASAHRGMVGLVEAGRQGARCRRAHLLELLGSSLSGPCSGCDVCNPEIAPNPSIEYALVSATKCACSLLQEVQATQSFGRTAWFVELLRRGRWRSECTTAEANATFLRLYASGVLDLGVSCHAGGGARALHVTVNKEKAAKILEGQLEVTVWCIARVP